MTERHSGFAIEGQIRELCEIEKKLPGVQSSVAEAQETLLGRPALDQERHGIKRQLGLDLDARKDGLAADPPDHIIHTLGPRPVSGTARLWDEALARIDQHGAVFDLADEGPILGSRHPAWEQSAFATSQREAASAVDSLNRSLGRGRVIEPPSLELGIGL